MEIDRLKEGLEVEMEYTVEDKHAASFIESGDVKVLSTPSMICMMEKTSRLLVQKYLPEGQTTVGTKVNVSHIKAVPVGVKVRIKSKLTRIEGRRLAFDVIAYWRDDKVGMGTHERYIVEKDRFLEKLRSSMSSTKNEA
ncbi:MAG: thioesterase family protein [Candidatus Asgardarchaeia archaeon]